MLGEKIRETIDIFLSCRFCVSPIFVFGFVREEREKKWGWVGSLSSFKCLRVLNVRHGCDRELLLARVVCARNRDGMSSVLCVEKRNVVFVFGFETDCAYLGPVATAPSVEGGKREVCIDSFFAARKAITNSVAYF